MQAKIKFILIGSIMAVVLASVKSCFALDVRALKREYLPTLQKTLTQLQGGAVAVIHHDKIVYLETFGKTRVGGEKIRKDTLFPLASSSKPIMASAIARLKGQNVLSLQENVAQKLGLKQPDLRLKHVMSHTSGYSFLADREIEAGASRAEIKRKYQMLQPDHHAGAHYQYSNFVYSLTQDIIEDITGESWIKAVEDTWRQIGITQTVAHCKVRENQHFASPHMRNKKTNEVKLWSLVPKNYPAAACASSGFFASITALAEFVKLNLGYYGHVIDEKTLQEFHTPHAQALEPLKWVKRWPVPMKDVQASYGLGWRIVGRKSDKKNVDRLVFHGGRLNGVSTFIGLIPHRKIGIVILANENNNLLQSGIDFWGWAQKQAK